MSPENKDQTPTSQMFKDDPDDEWEFVPPNTTQPSARNGTRSTTTSRSIVELRLSIGRTEWSYSSGPLPSRYTYSENVTAVRHDAQDCDITQQPPAEQTQSLFFQLSGEIRLYIYELVFRLVPDSNRSLISPVDSQHVIASILAPLGTCRRFLYEAEPIFYSTNRLRLERHTLLKVASIRRVRFIKALQISSNTATAVLQHAKDLHLAPNLQSLHIVSPSTSLRFVNVLNWKYLINQIEAELRKLDNLREVKVLWRGCVPEQAEVGELDREKVFAEVAKRLEAAPSA